MIHLSRLNGKPFVLNADLIKFVEATPDTIISLTTGEKIMVAEDVDTLVKRTIKCGRTLRAFGDQ